MTEMGVGSEIETTIVREKINFIDPSTNHCYSTLCKLKVIDTLSEWVK
jgi:hypothetical protein